MALNVNRFVNVLDCRQGILAAFNSPAQVSGIQPAASANDYPVIIA